MKYSLEKIRIISLFGIINKLIIIYNYLLKETSSLSYYLVYCVEHIEVLSPSPTVGELYGNPKCL